MQIPQSPQVIPVVPNRREAGLQCTATACNSRVAPSEIHSIRLSKKRALKAEPISLRALNTLKTWNRDECRERQRQGAVLWAGLQGVVQDRQGSCHHRQAANNDAGHPRQRKSVRPRGDSSMMPGRAALRSSDTAGGPSMMIATQRICRAVNGSGRPISGAKKTVRIAPMVVDN